MHATLILIVCYQVNNAEYVQRVLKGGDSKPSSTPKKDSDKKKKVYLRLCR